MLDFNVGKCHSPARKSLHKTYGFMKIQIAIVRRLIMARQPLVDHFVRIIHISKYPNTTIYFIPKNKTKEIKITQSPYKQRVSL